MPSLRKVIVQSNELSNYGIQYCIRRIAFISTRVGKRFMMRQIQNSAVTISGWRLAVQTTLDDYLNWLREEQRKRLHQEIGELMEITHPPWPG